MYGFISLYIRNFLDNKKYINIQEIVCQYNSMKLKDNIKGLVQSNGWNYVRLAAEMSKISGKEYTNKSLSQKIIQETIQYKEMLLIYQILGYKLKIEKDGTNN